ncbi:MAG: MoaD/ThiS family protein [Candidatus Bathyarchaeia archaeon]
MKIHVTFAGDAYKKFGTVDLWLSFQGEATVKEVIAKLEKEKSLKINLEDQSMVVLVNGRRVEFIGGLDARLKDMDEVVIMPIIAGG